ncbi:uncharacterized protein LOC131070492 [Cryptomeria japonica]|uniref:uncharacterized protein LOC131070492 n=1 Tax=Cryptomeria japonica TaxID=3369 RepID=UPI0025ABF1D8|nr:uncharacterized protein LOC131070492 [Cryptomeria japonica]
MEGVVASLLSEETRRKSSEMVKDALAIKGKLEDKKSKSKSKESSKTPGKSAKRSTRIVGRLIHDVLVNVLHVTGNINILRIHKGSLAEMLGESDQGTTAVEYKSGKREELVKKGYRIWGNVGEQLSDLTVTSLGSRTFKLPNPMYYIS